MCGGCRGLCVCLAILAGHSKVGDHLYGLNLNLTS